MQTIIAKVLWLGATRCVSLPVHMLVPNEDVRAACVRNRCNHYGCNYMCPPHIGSFDEIARKLGDFNAGVLFQQEHLVDKANDTDYVNRTQQASYDLVIAVEQYLKSLGIARVWGMPGGHCIVCTPCNAEKKNPCAYPNRARNSLEAIGIRVLTLNKALGLDCEFHDDKVVWTASVLWSDARDFSTSSMSPSGNR
ncbi:MAG: DUF2284 domain-containing protein [Deltaproteobacteria bacterium]|nr:DUF2284 domain-containing protein [Deltaproteobacteria bacterium]